MRPRLIQIPAAVLAAWTFLPEAPLPAVAPARAVSAGSADGTGAPVPVSGTGVHFFTTAIVHDRQATAAGTVQRSTETVELSGDLTGRILYHPTSVFDFANGTLVNTGHQVFSGSVLGSAPVLLHDDEFRFDVDLTTGATTGRVYLRGRIAGPKVRCELDVVGTGMTDAGDAAFTYTGSCRFTGEGASAAAP